MRKFKHKNSNSIVSGDSEKGYKLETDYWLPTWIIENSNDWKEVKEFPKIISFRRISDKMLYTLGGDDLYWGKEAIVGHTLDTMITQSENKGYTEIYQVAVSETEVFTLGDKVEIIMNRPKYSKSTISRFKLETNGCISVRVSEYCSVSLHDIKKAPKVLFVTEDGIEKYVNEDFYYIGDAWNLCITKCLYKGDGDFSRFKTFHNIEAAKQYISENKPIYSKKQVREAIESSFVRENYILDAPCCCADRFKEEIFKQKLVL